MIAERQWRGYLLEEALAWLLKDSGYALLTSPEDDRAELTGRVGYLKVKGRGADHQVDVLGEFTFTPAFSLPVRLFLEAKFRDRVCGLDVVRNAYGVVEDVNQNYVPDPRSKRPRRRYQYRYALFSANGFSPPAQAFAISHQISLIDLSGGLFTGLLEAVRTAARHINNLQTNYARPGSMNLGQLRANLRSRLGTGLDDDLAAEPDLGDLAETGVLVNSPASAQRILEEFTEDLQRPSTIGLLLGFPAAPFIITMATTDKARFLRYAEAHPSHRIQLHRVGSRPEWTASPASDRRAYELRFTLPEALETWISDNEESRQQRIRTVKTGFLANVMIYYRDHDGGVRACQLRYEAGELRRA